MTRHFDYGPSVSEGDNQSVRSSAPVVSRCFPGGYNVKLYISRGKLAWWLLALLHSVPKYNNGQPKIQFDIYLNYFSKFSDWQTEIKMVNLDGQPWWHVYEFMYLLYILSCVLWIYVW